MGCLGNVLFFHGYSRGSQWVFTECSLHTFHVFLMISLIGSGCNGPILQIRKVEFRDRGHTASELWNQTQT